MLSKVICAMLNQKLAEAELKRDAANLGQVGSLINELEKDGDTSIDDDMDYLDQQITEADANEAIVAIGRMKAKLDCPK